MVNSKKYYWILYIITATILITVAVQVYWNYNNYLTNKQRVVNDIQTGLDNALEEYYAHLVKTDYLTIVKSDSFVASDTLHKGLAPNTSIWNPQKRNKMDIKSINIRSDKPKDIDSMIRQVKKELNQQLHEEHQRPVDSIKAVTQLLPNGKGFHFDKTKGYGDVQILKGRKAFDSLKIMQNLGTILISMEQDSIDYQRIDSLLNVQFQQKNMTPDYVIKHYKADTLYHSSIPGVTDKNPLFVDSKSTYLKTNERITLSFKNPYMDALKLSSTGIVLSFLLSMFVISCLFYLLRIIQAQKQLAEIKNDLISNITHEFKTPISTISVALESIKSFDGIDDKLKTMNYLDISSQQLSKLTVMVEKLLETATLDSENLELNKQNSDITGLLQQLVDKHNLQKTGQPIQFNIDPTTIEAFVDDFHLENALNNVLDNAIKYGGEAISLTLNQDATHVFITISDSGTSLKNINKDRLFEKFYRVPKGNTHDVKGFGIGLYYTKRIIEKHGGRIELDVSSESTNFKITIPND